MYSAILLLHSWLRWVVIPVAILATVSALGPGPKPGYKDALDRWALLLTIFLDLQLLLGMLLYVVLSPTTSAIFDDFGAAMRDPVARFWAVEHIGTMIVAIVMAHVGRSLTYQAPTPAAKRTRALICFGIVTAAVLAATPWPGMRAGRPLFRTSL